MTMRQWSLGPHSARLLAVLMEEPGVVVSRRRLAEEVWESGWYTHSRTVDVHVGALRRKVGDPAWIETVRGIGFRPLVSSGCATGGPCIGFSAPTR